MSLEIEHKYLVENDNYKIDAICSTLIKQGYLSTDKARVVRIRTRGDSAFITVKGKNDGAKRLEYEYPIPVTDAEAMLEQLCVKPIIEKVRYNVPYEGNVWEVDEFKGALDGLVIAEIEIPYLEYKYDIPPFIGKDVTNDSRYYNSNLKDTVPSPD